MTVSDHTKVFKQLKIKPAKLTKYKKHNQPKERSMGVFRVKCRRCGQNRGFIGKYKINLCRQCFREIASDLGFKKFS